MYDRPYNDPLRDQIDELETSIELTTEHGSVFYEHPDQYMDGWARLAGAVEADIEGTIVPPPKLEEAVRIAPPEGWFEGRGQGFVTQAPPLPPEHEKASYISIEPPQAARPFYTHDGLMPAQYHPRRGGRTGIRNTEQTESAQLHSCPKDKQDVTTEDCQSCDHWGDHDGGGFESCAYDSREGDTRESNENPDE